MDHDRDPLPWLALPGGMRDLVPPSASERRDLETELLELLRLSGYALVTTPPFEHEEVLEPALRTEDRDLLRFVEPESGKVALLRPDITPQVARVIATRLADRPPPHRLCYLGTVVRQRHGRARRHRQISQLGLECVGLGAPEADLEVIELAASLVRRAGVSDAKLELRLTGFGSLLLQQVDPGRREDVRRALIRKDRSDVERLSESEAPALRTSLIGLTELYGGAEVLDAAKEIAKGEAEEALGGLRSLVDALADRELGLELCFDLGEISAMSYYTGPSFVILAEGPGTPIGAGGRYDDLLPTLGVPYGAVGFAVDLDSLAWAKRHVQAEQPGTGDGVLLVGPEDASRRLSRSLRGHGIRAAVHSHGDPLEYASAWGFSAVGELRSKGTVRVQRVLGGEPAELTEEPIEALVRFLKSQ
ncbi:MAG: ATP phosphoribosyltransferase regulatory subunit [Myxococcota bacterium]